MGRKLWDLLKSTTTTPIVLLSNNRNRVDYLSLGYSVENNKNNNNNGTKMNTSTKPTTKMQSFLIHAKRQSAEETYKFSSLSYSNEKGSKFKRLY